MYNSKNYLLIGGTGRCGTSILRDIFSCHPQVATVPEWRFLIDPDGIIDFYVNIDKLWSPYMYDVKLKRLEKLLSDVCNDSLLSKIRDVLLRKSPYLNSFIKTSRYYGIRAEDSVPDFKNFSQELVKGLTDIKFYGHWTGNPLHSTKLHIGSNNLKHLKEVLQNFFNKIIEQTLSRQSADYYLEKNTWNILYFDKIKELLPEAKLLHIYRDPRDVVASFCKQLWMPTKMEDAAEIYQQLIHRWHEVRKKVPDNAFLEISLEKLSAEPDLQLKKICDFWNLPWHDELLRTELNKTNRGRWAKDFPEMGKQNWLNKKLSKEIAEFGYDQ